ncbi:uncharacterized protein LOC111871496 [Cryptotermes secundus]|uniref:uncharacterized protein LOC111871496 n=1 Tax=Cryptotermes secundus TaxID=105785 RepID=UPI000CD7B626|nr:uncharacterized protein LOC111871496 [Cryptotermes secundus]
MAFGYISPERSSGFSSAVRQITILRQRRSNVSCRYKVSEEHRIVIMNGNKVTGLLVLCAVSALFLARTVYAYRLCEDILKKCKDSCKVLVHSDCESDEEFIPAKSPCNCCAYCVPKVLTIPPRRNDNIDHRN